MEILIENKESLVEKIREYLLDDLQKTLETLELDEEEKYANIILSRKKLLVDSKNIADLIYSAYEM
jgi:hypothetical protein